MAAEDFVPVVAMMIARSKHFFGEACVMVRTEIEEAKSRALSEDEEDEVRRFVATEALALGAYLAGRLNVGIEDVIERVREEHAKGKSNRDPANFASAVFD